MRQKWGYHWNTARQGWDIDGPGYGTVAHVWGDMPSSTAELVAAAPELLDALEELEPILDELRELAERDDEESAKWREAAEDLADRVRRDYLDEIKHALGLVERFKEDG